MCGITGFAGKGFEPSLLEEMLEKIRHRGPDGKGLKLFNNCGLGHARLSIIDLSDAGLQPMSNEDSSLFLTYNGEIYNYLELKSLLLGKGHVFKSNTDSEVLLHLYEEYGTAMLEKLNGIFAFAIWNTKTEELFLARDNFGVKPLYYSELPEGFLFSSELKSFTCCKNLPKEIDSKALFLYMTYLWAPAPYTMFKSVRKLPPGNAVMVSGDGKIKKIWKWYTVPFDNTRIGENENEIASTLAEKLKKSVERQLMSDVPLGAFLSGGLDSSSIVAFMRELNPDKKIKAYCIGFPEGDSMDGSPEDMYYARMAAEKLRIDLEKIVVMPETILSKIEELVYFLDEPQADPAPINAMLIAEKARSDGIKVLLSGAGGDDIFTGYRRHTALNMEKYWEWIPAPFLKSLAMLGEKAGNGLPFMRRFNKVFSHADESPEERLFSYFKWSPTKLRASLINNDLLEDFGAFDEDAAFVSTLEEIPEEKDNINRMLYLEIQHFLADHNLNYTDKTAMRHGVEVRVPFLDPDLVNYSSKLPPSLKQRGCCGKFILKKAMQNYLPKKLIYRKKTGFGVPLRKWIRFDLSETVYDLLSAESLQKRSLFDPEGVKNLIELNKSGEIDASYLIFSLLCVEIWCRIFIDNNKI